MFPIQEPSVFRTAGILAVAFFIGRGYERYDARQQTPPAQNIFQTVGLSHQPKPQKGWFDEVMETVFGPQPEPQPSYWSR